MSWEIKEFSKLKAKDSVIIEGLPGMGNVGKIAVDFMVDALHAKKLCEFSSYDLPHCVFVNEENMIELPTIKAYYKELKNRSLIFITGDIQPVSEKSCYEFCNKVLDTFENKKMEIITLGGIAIPKIPKDPKVYCTGNSKKAMEKFNSDAVSTRMYGIVGPIIGVSGLLPGLAGKRKIPAVALLAETVSQANHLGIKGARNLLRVLNKQLKLGLDIKGLDEEIKELEKELTKKEEPQKQQKKVSKEVFKIVTKQQPEQENQNYFG